MLGALHRSKEDQQRLVQDASHELRTPLTSLRTNISVLRRYDHLDPDTRRRLLDDLDGETRELAVMVDELVELATERRSNEPEQLVALGEVATNAVDRARRRTSRPIVLVTDESTVIGRPHALERAITNLVENTVKFDDLEGGPIEVTVRDRRVEVGDRGPGFEPVDLPHIFDRFYRAVSARAAPGSGLGLSIVRAVVESHGGQVFAENRAGGGRPSGSNCLRLLPTSNPPAVSRLTPLGQGETTRSTSSRKGRFMKKRLTALGLTVGLVAGGAAGLALGVPGLSSAQSGGTDSTTTTPPTTAAGGTQRHDDTGRQARPLEVDPRRPRSARHRGNTHPGAGRRRRPGAPERETGRRARTPGRAERLRPGPGRQVSTPPPRPSA